MESYKAADGKRRYTDVANVQQLLRIIQSIPTKKAEPFKVWLAEVGAERLDEIADPEKAMERAVISSSNATTPEISGRPFVKIIYTPV